MAEVLIEKEGAKFNAAIFSVDCFLFELDLRPGSNVPNLMQMRKAIDFY